jgi:hypothetical protein
MLSANRYGLNTRDYLQTSLGNYSGIFALADNNNNVTCNGYEYGEGSSGTFNTTYNRVFAPWTNPSSHTWGNQETNFEMQVTSQNGSTIHAHFYLGNMIITENTTLVADTYNFTGNLTVASGVTLTIQPGVTVTFASGASLIVNGTLNAAGNSTNLITFTRSGTSGTWGGIRFNNGSGGNLQYCNIQNASTGIYCNNSSPTIDHCTIKYCGTGIYCDYYSSPTLTYNLLESNTTAYGLWCSAYSSPTLQRNVIRSNSYSGVNAIYNSNPDLGVWGNGGFNSIYSNTFAVSAAYGCYVSALFNWWGGTPQCCQVKH